ncbi:MAG: Ig-like domain repeat protein [Candidatus Riflebacteria bacterium]|nr:Ig-like domain repeat protein [Candidatus Riflebacteria bacterium]
MTTRLPACRKALLVLLATHLSLVAGLFPAWAGISNLTCAVQTPADLTRHYNAGQVVTLSANWTGDTPPFAATFKANTIPIGTANTTAGSAQFTTTVAGLAGDSVAFSASVIETAIPGATPSPDAGAAGNLLIDRQAPTLTLTVDSGAIVSPQNGFNEVVLSFTSNEALAGPPQFTIAPGTWGAPTPVSPESAPYTSNRYRITVPAGTAAGVYTVRVTGFDDTDPAATRNQSTAQTAFQVDAGADGSPVILSCSPQSPIRTESVTLSGTVSAESSAQKVEVLEGGAVVGTVPVAGGADSWSVTVSGLTEGSHSYTARRIDPLGNVSAASAEFTVVADRTAPHEPVLEPVKKPSNNKKVTIRGTAVTDPPHDSRPLKVTLFSGSTQLATTNANADGTFTFTDVEMPSTGQNQLYAMAADTTWNGTDSTGNKSPYSPPITVVIDQEAPYIVPGGISIGRSGTTAKAETGPVVLAPPPAVVFRQAETTVPLPGLAVLPPPVALSAPPGAVPAPAGASTGPGGPPAPVPPFTPAGPTLPPGAPPVANAALMPVAEGFQPPMGGWGDGLVPVRLPLAVLRDRSPQRVRVWLDYRKAGQTMGTKYLVPLTLGGGFFTGWLPNDPQAVFYRFRLADAAGNESFFPPDGELLKGSRRSATLRLLQRPRWYETVPDADEWPVGALGLPPLDRLLAYRRLAVPASLRAEVEALLADRPEAAGVEIVEAGGADGAAQPWKRDLDLLSAGRLPVERLGILVPEVVNGEVPLSLLPDPDRLPDDPAWEALREAIRFRRLHEPSP